MGDGLCYKVDETLCKFFFTFPLSILVEEAKSTAIEPNISLKCFAFVWFYERRLANTRLLRCGDGGSKQNELSIGKSASFEGILEGLEEKMREKRGNSSSGTLDDRKRWQCSKISHLFRKKGLYHTYSDFIIIYQVLFCHMLLLSNSKIPSYSRHLRGNNTFYRRYAAVISLDGGKSETREMLGSKNELEKKYSRISTEISSRWGGTADDVEVATQLIRPGKTASKLVSWPMLNAGTASKKIRNIHKSWRKGECGRGKQGKNY